MATIGGRLAIQASFVSAYRIVLWIGAGLAIAASASAAVLIEPDETENTLRNCTLRTIPIRNAL